LGRDEPRQGGWIVKKRQGGWNSIARSRGSVAQTRVNKSGGRHLITTAVVNFDGLVGGTLPDTFNNNTIMVWHRRRNLTQGDTKIEEGVGIHYVIVRHGLACVRVEMGDRHLRLRLGSRREK
jgi:hypothetical protein